MKFTSITSVKSLKLELGRNSIRTSTPLPSALRIPALKMNSVKCLIVSCFMLFCFSVSTLGSQITADQDDKDQHAGSSDDSSRAVLQGIVDQSTGIISGQTKNFTVSYFANNEDSLFKEVSTLQKQLLKAGYSLELKSFVTVQNSCWLAQICLTKIREVSQFTIKLTLDVWNILILPGNVEAASEIYGRPGCQLKSIVEYFSNFTRIKIRISC